MHVGVVSMQKEHEPAPPEPEKKEEKEMRILMCSL